MQMRLADRRAWSRHETCRARRVIPLTVRRPFGTGAHGANGTHGFRYAPPVATRLRPFGTDRRMPGRLLFGAGPGGVALQRRGHSNGHADSAHRAPLWQVSCLDLPYRWCHIGVMGQLVDPWSRRGPHCEPKRGGALNRPVRTADHTGSNRHAAFAHRASLRQVSGLDLPYGW